MRGADPDTVKHCRLNRWNAGRRNLPGKPESGGEENPDAETDRELVIFRDSYGSSLAPLLVKGYSKITLVDIRYLASPFVGQYVRFDSQDVLFLYSTSVLNNSITLK